MTSPESYRYDGLDHSPFWFDKAVITGDGRVWVDQIFEAGNYSSSGGSGKAFHWGIWAVARKHGANEVHGYKRAFITWDGTVMDENEMDRIGSEYIAACGVPDSNAIIYLDRFQRNAKRTSITAFFHIHGED